MWLLDIANQKTRRRQRTSNLPAQGYLRGTPSQERKSRRLRGIHNIVPVSQTKHTRKYSEGPAQEASHYTSKRRGFDNRRSRSSLRDDQAQQPTVPISMSRQRGRCYAHSSMATDNNQQSERQRTRQYRNSGISSLLRA